MATTNLDNDDGSDADMEEFDVNAVEGLVALHYVSKFLKASVNSHGYKIPFPPCAQSTTYYAAVSPDLFKFIAVITGLVKDIDNFFDYASIRSDYATKLLSSYRRDRRPNRHGVC